MTNASILVEQNTKGEASVYIGSAGSSYIDVVSGESARKPSPREITWTLRLLAGLNKEGGEFVSYCLSLPGAVSCGSTRKEALENLREAVVGCILSYREAGQGIPWADASGSKDKYDFAEWIAVDV